MELLMVDRYHADLRLAESELVMLNNALNETCNGLDLDEFETRMGSTKEQVRDLLSRIGMILDNMAQSGSDNQKPG